MLNPSAALQKFEFTFKRFLYLDICTFSWELPGCDTRRTQFQYVRREDEPSLLYSAALPRREGGCGIVERHEVDKSTWPLGMPLC